MSPRIRRCLSLLLFVAVCAGGPSARAQEGGGSDTDSLLWAYYREVRAHVNDPEAPQRCDTLFRRAGEAGDRRMQAVALCLRLDHDYFRNDRERIREGVQRVKDFCAAHPDREELRYFYYFAWGSRLVTYYIKQNQSNVAVYETRKMLTEAQKEGYARGVAMCYGLLANLYLSQGDHKLAYDNFRLQIDQIERNGIEEINLPTHYASMAQCALEMNMPDTALVALRKADTLSMRSAYQRFTVDKSFALYYIQTGDLPAARQRLDAIEEAFRNEPKLSTYRSGLYYIEAAYYKAAGDYRRALDVVLRSQRDTVLIKNDYAYYSLSLELANIYYKMGDMGRAAENYRQYVLAADSVHRQEVRNATNDFSGLLEVGRLQNETREMQLDLQRRRLRSTYLVILLLGCVLIAGTALFARIMRLNRRLKASEALVTEQNEHLVAAGEQLRAAKERAEQVSSLKTNFIQNMSHEVRTPLNSIVGFSQVLASQFRNDPSAGEYASIIETNSQNLLRLIDDVLDISFLDQTDNLPANDRREMNSCCRECADNIVREVAPGVSVQCELSSENPVVRTNIRRVAQVLNHLLHNAVKFTEQGTISLSYNCLEPEGVLRFTVTDTGPGIPAGMHEQVFERFVKLDAFSQGSGLGLPVCRVIADKLGGRLYVDPAYTGGCRMVFEIPYLEA
ncbi:ATP-binding protein [Alistipes sp.]|uniref:sensor histidine kinase n=1 Tax=Alistipes sp. TaxID=1872444 RepID=UPI003AF0A757